MNILQIHKYYTKKRSGGSIKAFFETVQLLEKRGQRVTIFSMKDPQNELTPFEPYFADHFDINEAKGIFEKIKLAARSIYNKQAQGKLEELVLEEKPDVAHVHNIYHYLTPSIFRALRKHSVPIVMKLSDYKVICPNYKLFTEGAICERCKGGKYYNCLIHKCLKNSRGISFVGMVEAYFHRLLGSYDLVDFFLAPSQFMRDKCVEFGIPREKIKLLRNVMNVENFDFVENRKENKTLVYFGRVSEEKGLGDLIGAVKILLDENKLDGHKVLVIGEGPEEAALEELAQRLGVAEHVEFMGFHGGKELFDMVVGAKCAILPSIWYDNSPVSISEAYMLGLPVIVSNLGGSPEMVRENETGFLFEAGNERDLAKKISWMLGMEEESRKKMGKAGREFVLELNNEDKYYDKLMGVYEKAIAEKKKGRRF